MNEDPPAAGLMLSWQGQETGPHSLREIHKLLRVGKIHSLFKVQVDGEWMLLRDHLADLNHQERSGQAVPETRTLPPVFTPTGGIPQAIPVPDAPAWHGTAGDPSAAEPQALAIAAFVLSLLVCVPYLNGITGLLTLILGHLALRQSDPDQRGPFATLAWVALWLGYVEVSFFLLALLWLMVTGQPPSTLVYLVLHGLMLFNLLAAVIGAGVLMLMVRLTTGGLLAFPECFVGALVPSAAGALGILMVQTETATAHPVPGEQMILLGGVNIVLFLLQMFFWGSFVRLPGAGRLGLARAALVSLPHTAVFALIGLAQLLLFSAFR